MRTHLIEQIENPIETVKHRTEFIDRRQLSVAFANRVELRFSTPEAATHLFCGDETFVVREQRRGKWGTIDEVLQHLAFVVAT